MTRDHSFDPADDYDATVARVRSLLVQSRTLVQLTNRCLSQSQEALAVSRELLSQPLYDVPTGQPRARLRPESRSGEPE